MTSRRKKTPKPKDLPSKQKRRDSRKIKGGMPVATTWDPLTQASSEEKQGPDIDMAVIKNLIG